MAVTLDQLEEFLKQKEMNYERDDEENLIQTGIGDSENSGMIFIRSLDDGKNFLLQLEPIKKDKSGMFDIDFSHQNINKVLMFLMYKNYSYKHGKWEYNFNDGDLRFSISIPLEDAIMTFDQFDTLIRVCYSSLDEIGSISYILENGEIPEEKSGEEKMAEMLRKMLSEIEGKKSDSDDEGI